MHSTNCTSSSTLTPLSNTHSSLTVNLSNLELTAADISLLDKGLSFIPTYRWQPIDRIYSAQHRLVRNLKLKDYFSNKPDKEYDYKTKTFTHPSTWIPADHKVSQETLDTVQNVISATENVIKNNKGLNGRFLALRRFKNNLSHAETLALKKLRSTESIVIKPADKGSATVVMDKALYLAEAYRQLNNTNYYSKLDQPIYKNNISKINEILKSMEAEGYITAKQFAYLQAKDSDRPRIFYLLPKIHKAKEKWPNPKMPEGRPIVSDCGSESYRVCEYIDSFLRPISIKHPSYLKDTYDFVSKIRGQKIPKNAFICSADVSSLYTNMNINRILDVCRGALARHTAARRPDKHLLNLLEITLKNNDFTFNGEYFLQICGTAMGKTYAPGLADMYLEEFDYQANHGFRVKPLLYSRFLDDIFFVWTGTLAELGEYEIFLNSLIDGIKITLNHSQEKVDFLDTTVYKQETEDEDVLQTRVFFKETDTHQLLHKTSFHPKHTAKGVLKSQLLRFKRISSSHSDYSNACRILFDALSERNYSKSMLRKMKRDIWLSNDTLRSNVLPDNPILPIVIPYNNIGTDLARHWKDAINQNASFQNMRLITAYCNGQNLYKKLVRSSLLPINNSFSNKNDTQANRTLGCMRCPNVKCRACNYIVECNSVKSSHNNRSFKLRSKFTCKSNNIVYLVTCRKCLQQYVGETGRSLAERITDHLSCIRLRKATPIGLHFNSVGHSVKDFAISAIEQFENHTNASNLRRIKEAAWQNLLQTAYPLGINNLKRDFVT